MGVVDLKELFVLERWRKLHGDCPIPPRLAVWPDAREVAKEGFVKNKGQDDYWQRFPDPARVALLRWQVRQVEEKLEACAQPLQLCKRAVASSRSAFEEHRTAYEAHCSTMSAMRDLMANGGLCFPAAEGLEDGSLTVVPKRCIGCARCFFCRERAQLEAEERQEDPFLADMSSCSEHPVAGGVAAPWRSKAKAVSSTSRPENEEQMVVHQPGPGFLRTREPGQESSGPGHEEIDYRARSTSRERQLRKPYRLRGSTAYKRKAQEAVVAKSLPEEETWFEKHTEDPGAGGAVKVDSPEDLAVFESAANKFKADWSEAFAEASMRSPLEVGVEDGVEGATASPVSRKPSMAADRRGASREAAAPFSTLFARPAVTQPASGAPRASSSGQPPSSQPSASSQGSNAEDRRRPDVVTQPAFHPVATADASKVSGANDTERFGASVAEALAALASGDDRTVQPEMGESRAQFEEGGATAAAISAPAAARGGWSSGSGDLAAKAKAALASTVRSQASSSGSSNGSGGSRAKQQRGSTGVAPAASTLAAEVEQADASSISSRALTLVDRRWSRVAAVAALSAAHQLLLSELCFVEWRRAHDRRKRAVAAAVWQPVMQADFGSRAGSRRQSIASSVSAAPNRKQQSSRASQAAQSGSEREAAQNLDRSLEDAHAGPSVQTDSRRHSLASSAVSAVQTRTQQSSRPSQAGQSGPSGSERDMPPPQVAEQQSTLEESIQDADASPGSRASSHHQSVASSASAGRMRMQHSSRPSQPAQSGSERDLPRLAEQLVEDADVGPGSQPASRPQSLSSSASARWMRMQQSDRPSQAVHSGSDRGIAQAARQALEGADASPSSSADSIQRSAASSGSAGRMRTRPSTKASQAAQSGSEQDVAQVVEQILEDADASPGLRADSRRQSVASSSSAGRVRMQHSSRPSQAAQSGSEQEHGKGEDQHIQEGANASPGSRADSQRHSPASSASGGRMRHQSSRASQPAQSSSEKETVEAAEQSLEDSHSPGAAGEALRLAESLTAELTDADASSSLGHGRHSAGRAAAASTPAASTPGSETSPEAALRVDQSLEESRSSVGQAEVEPVLTSEPAETETSSPSVDQRRRSRSGIVASPGGETTSTPGPSVSDSEARARPVQLEVQSLEESHSQGADSLSGIAALELAGQEAARSTDHQSSADEMPFVSGGAARSPTTLSLASGSRRSSQLAQVQESPRSHNEAVSSDEERRRNADDSVLSSPARDQQRHANVGAEIGQPAAGEGSAAPSASESAASSPQALQLGDDSFEDAREAGKTQAEAALDIAVEPSAIEADPPPAGTAMAASKKRELLERLRQRRAQGVRTLAAPRVLANPASTATDATTETVTSVASVKEAPPLEIAATDLYETVEQEDGTMGSSAAQPEGRQRAASSSSVSAAARPVTPLTSSDTLTCSATDASPLRPPANRARADSSAARTAGGESSSAAASTSPAMVRRMTESSVNEDTVSEIRVQSMTPGTGDRSSTVSESPSSIDQAESIRSRTGQATGLQGSSGRNAAQTSPSSPSSSSGSDSFD